MHLSGLANLYFLLLQMDYFARAKRVEEIPKLKQQYDEHLVQDKQFWEEQEEERVSGTVSNITLSITVIIK